MTTDNPPRSPEGDRPKEQCSAEITMVGALYRCNFESGHEGSHNAFDGAGLLECAWPNTASSSVPATTAPRSRYEQICDETTDMCHDYAHANLSALIRKEVENERERYEELLDRKEHENRQRNHFDAREIRDLRAQLRDLRDQLEIARLRDTAQPTSEEIASLAEAIEILEADKRLCLYHKDLRSILEKLRSSTTDETNGGAS